ncbi:MAG: PKD domain-containing protein [Actinomycetota bacterium]|nr:PKD domain-containing protein [Actinomycetota bacterium]
MKHARNNKKTMKHARVVDKGMKHARKPEPGEKRKATVKRKTVFTILGIIALIAIAVVVALNFQPIYKFMDRNITALLGFLSSIGSKNNEVSDNNIEKENDGELVSGDVDDPSKKEEASSDEEDDDEDEDEKNSKTPPSIKLEIYEGPLYSRAGDVCYYRVKANVTGSPTPSITFSKDDSLGSLGPGKAQVNISRDKKYYILTAVAENTEGKASDTMTLVWNCNAGPEIKGITLSSSTVFVGEKYDIFVDAVDPDGDELSFEWNVAGGTIDDKTKNPTKWNAPDKPGDYNISVSVSDVKGNISNTSITIYVGKVVVETPQASTETPTTKDIAVPRIDSEGGYIEYGGNNGSSIYAGDSENNLPCSGFVSFDISGLKGGKVQSAALTLRSAGIKGDPLSFFKKLNINVLSWGKRPIKQDDFKAEGIFIASYDTPDITCNVSELKAELQKAIDSGKSRFQIRIHFSGPWTNNDGKEDGWEYSQSNVNLKVTITK